MKSFATVLAAIAALLLAPAHAAEPSRARVAQPKTTVKPQAPVGPGARAPAPAATTEVKVVLRDWEVRRNGVTRALTAVVESQGRDKAAMEHLDAVLGAFEQDMVSITPMEGMDLQRYFYIPRDDGGSIRTSLTVVAMLATLGWYDALRFADESGRAEIVNNEQFFSRAFGQDETIRQLVDFLANRPKEAAEAVEKGQALARLYRGRTHYDERWPTAYGLGRMRCAMQGIKDCPGPTPLPEEKWDAAFDEAVARVTHYYRNNE